jgi:DNA-binding GntR family transcriptional regulator
MGGQEGPAAIAGVGRDSVTAAALRLAIDGRDLPPGLRIDGEALAARFEWSAAQCTRALEVLRSEGLVARDAAGWVVLGAGHSPRALLARARPLMIALARLAAGNRSAGHVALLFEAHGLVNGFGFLPQGEDGARRRADGYRLLLRTLARATGSAYCARVLDRLLEEAGPLVELVIVRQAIHADPRNGGELLRLCESVDDRDPDGAEAAIQDHLVMLGHHLDTLALSVPASVTSVAKESAWPDRGHRG